MVQATVWRQCPVLEGQQSDFTSWLPYFQSSSLLTGLGKQQMVAGELGPLPGKSFRLLVGPNPGCCSHLGRTELTDGRSRSL